MPRKLIIAAAIAVAVAGFAVPAGAYVIDPAWPAQHPLPAPVEVPAEDPVFGDEFDGTEVDPAKWWIADGPNGGPDGMTTWSKDAVRVQNGVLTITADEQGRSGHLDIVPDHARKYGRWEVRARFPVGGGYNPGLFLWPAQDVPVPKEYDFAEGMDNSRQSIQAFVHITENDRLDKSKDLDVTQWHTYALEWTPDKLVFSIDGQDWWTVDDQRAQFDGDMALMMELYRWPENGAAQETKVEIDWARIYAR